jgi:signal transduction histidine kinase
VTTVAGLVGVPATVVTLYGISVLGGAQAAFATWLLAPTGTEANRQVEELAQSRSRLVNSFEAERRRIERDLHDGAQQHLVLLTMKLGLVERHLADAGGRAGELVGEARGQARLALTTLRDQIRGIHPQILTDLGLTEAVRELAERCPIPVEVDLELSGRLPPEIESTAYFVVSEALTNAVRHAAATRIQISGGLAEQRLALTIVDDGRGGAEPSLGTGMRGLADRVAVVAGTLEISSPQGGPTTLRIDLPCRYE